MKTARITAWGMCGKHSPAARARLDNPLVIDIDATEVASHSDKQHAMATWKKHFGFYPLAAIVDHGPGLIGEPTAVLLSPANGGGSGNRKPYAPECYRSPVSSSGTPDA